MHFFKILFLLALWNSFAAHSQSDSIRFNELGDAEVLFTQKPLFLYFNLANCPPCRKMEETVFTDTAIVALVNRRYTPVRVSSLEGRKRFGVSGLPTTIICGEGTEVFRKIVGFIAADTLRKLLLLNRNLSTERLRDRIIRGVASADDYYKYLESLELMQQNDSLIVSQFFGMLTEDELATERIKLRLVHHLLFDFKSNFDYAHPAFAYFLDHERSYYSVADSSLLCSMRTFALSSELNKAILARDEPKVLAISGRFGNQHGATDLYAFDGRLIGATFSENYRISSLKKWYTSTGDLIKADSCDRLLFEFCKQHPRYLETLCDDYSKATRDTPLKLGLEICNYTLREKETAAVYTALGEIHKKLGHTHRANKAFRHAARLTETTG